MLQYCIRRVIIARPLTVSANLIKILHIFLYIIILLGFLLFITYWYNVINILIDKYAAQKRFYFDMLLLLFYWIILNSVINNIC